MLARFVEADNICRFFYFMCAQPNPITCRPTRRDELGLGSGPGIGSTKLAALSLSVLVVPILFLAGRR